ncbi:hypothetical protein HK405_006471 [Cladochytrium tenue]|nr:hypothetical protein HK405_006471 [Cladochytrium tenue]
MSDGSDDDIFDLSRRKRPPPATKPPPPAPAPVASASRYKSFTTTARQSSSSASSSSFDSHAISQALQPSRPLATHPSASSSTPTGSLPLRGPSSTLSRPRTSPPPITAPQPIAPLEKKRRLVVDDEDSDSDSDRLSSEDAPSPPRRIGSTIEIASRSPSPVPLADTSTLDRLKAELEKEKSELEGLVPTSGVPPSHPPRPAGSATLTLLSIDDPVTVNAAPFSVDGLPAPEPAGPAAASADCGDCIVRFWAEGADQPRKLRYRLGLHDPLSVMRDDLARRLGISPPDGVVLRAARVTVFAVSTLQGLARLGCAHPTMNDGTIRIDAYERGYYEHLHRKMEMERSSSLQQLEESEEPLVEPDAADNDDSHQKFITVRLNDSSNEPLKLRVAKTSTIRELVAMYLAKRELPANTRTRIELDHEDLGLDDVVGSLDIESGDMLDVRTTSAH